LIIVGVICIALSRNNKASPTVQSTIVVQQPMQQQQMQQMQMQQQQMQMQQQMLQPAAQPAVLVAQQMAPSPITTPMAHPMAPAFAMAPAPGIPVAHGAPPQVAQSVRELREIAAAVGAPADAIEDARDAANPAQALRDLIAATQQQPRQGP
jgi:hypothetical protein